MLDSYFQLIGCRRSSPMTNLNWSALSTRRPPLSIDPPLRNSRLLTASSPLPLPLEEYWWSMLKSTYLPMRRRYCARRCFLTTCSCCTPLMKQRIRGRPTHFEFHKLWRRKKIGPNFRHGELLSLRWNSGKPETFLLCVFHARMA